ncbi:MAG: YibE/F family protein [Candidatus Shapirobacteria bacterium]|nr:YibE/F family protein [Candidatus Shapirobacteria bacterium]
MKKRLLFLLFLFCLFFGFFSKPLAQEETLMEGEIIEILVEEDHLEQIYQQVLVLVKTGRFVNQKVTVETGFYDPLSGQRFKTGDKIILALSSDMEGNNVFYIADYVRRPSLLLLAAIFVLLVLFIGRTRGFFSLIGLVLSFVVIMFLVLPLINQGGNPVLISVLASVLMVPLLFYSAHGFNRKTTVAAASTIIALTLTGVLARTFVVWANISGLSSEEMGFLQISHQGLINPQGLVLAGIIIGALGVLDDVTISQSAVVEKLKKVNPKINPKRLFKESLSVGQDHIASMVNTLVLVYAGASLPLLLLFINSTQKISLVVNYEIVAEELIRILVGSIGLIAAVPITTFLAVVFVRK